MTQIRTIKNSIILMMLMILMIGSVGAAASIVDNGSDSIFLKMRNAVHNPSLTADQSFQSDDKINPIVQLNGGYAIRIIAVDQETLPYKLWLALEKNNVKLDDKILSSGDEYFYANEEDSIKFNVEAFVSDRATIVFLKNLYQSSNGKNTLSNESFTLILTQSFSFSSNVQVEPDSRSRTSISNGKNMESAVSYLARTITVDDDGIADYTNIQDAIDASNSGDTIYIKNGTYYEHLFIYKNNLTIIGENKEKTIIDGRGEGGIVNLYGANNNTIKNVTVQGNTLSFPPVSGYSRVFLKDNYSIVLVSSPKIGIIPTVTKCFSTNTNKLPYSACFKKTTHPFTNHYPCNQIPVLFFQ